MEGVQLNTGIFYSLSTFSPRLKLVLSFWVSLGRERILREISESALTRQKYAEPYRLLLLIDTGEFDLDEALIGRTDP